jgi:hypothetical protein
MARTSAELTSLYGELRAALLSRHFAIGRYFRANFLSLDNQLGAVQQPGSATPKDRDDAEVGCNAKRMQPPAYTGAGDLLSKPRATQDKERWRIANRVRENPLMLSSQLLVCLAVERYLGRTFVEPIIRAALRTIRSMYKFDGAFRGYPVRWDAVASDRWTTRSANGRTLPRFPCEFLISEDRSSYLYCTPFQHPSYTPYIRNEEFARLTLDEKRAYWTARHYSLQYLRVWEPSMDELVGLICAYDIVFRLVDDSEIREEVRQQADRLGEYLAEHGYLLVRPCGGFTARGSADILPVLEFPWQRVFERITGNRYEPRVGFEGACDQAGVWGSLEGPMRTATVVGGAIGGVVGGFPLALIRTGALGAIAGVLGAALGIAAGIVGARALTIYGHRDCFDVWSLPGDGSDEFKEERNYQEAFLVAYLFKKLPPAFRFRFWFGGVEDHGSGPAAWFPAFIGLTGLEDPEGTVRRMYLKFLSERRKHTERSQAEYDRELQRAQEGGDPEEIERATSRPRLEPDNIPLVDKYADNPFASAVAVVLGAGEAEEQKLVELLEKWHDTLVDEMGRDFALEGWKENDDAPELVSEAFRPALQYMAALALAWLHAKRRADVGTPLPPELEFPTPPAASTAFPEPRVPQVVLDAAETGELGLPPDTWGARIGGPPAGGELFGGQAVPPKREEAPPPDLKPSDQKQLVTDRTIDVFEADSNVDTEIDLRTEDELRIDATGEIWAGVWGTGRNGPDGWDRIDDDVKFHVHGPPNGHPYALIAKIGVGGGYFFVGSRYPSDSSSRHLHVAPTQRLYLRTNDDTPNNGSRREPGACFRCRVRVWR